MRIIQQLICTVLIAMVSGCVAPGSASCTSKLRLGMSKEEAIEVMGKPEVVVPVQASEIYQKLRLTPQQIAEFEKASAGAQEENVDLRSATLDQTGKVEMLVLTYYFDKSSGDDDFGLQPRDMGAIPISSSRVRSPRRYCLKFSVNRLVAFGISTELEPERAIPNKAIEFGVSNDNHWKIYEIKTKYLRLGMTKEEMIKVLGQPDSFGANSQFEYLNFLRHSNGEGGERRYKLRAYIARFLNGRLERFWCEAF